jgi:hypothetical protein
VEAWKKDGKAAEKMCWFPVAEGGCGENESYSFLHNFLGQDMLYSAI